MARRAFDLAAFRAKWRDLAADHGLDPISGEPLAATDAGWWRNPDLWTDAGPSHSVVEAAALASIAQQARAAVGKPEPVAVSTDLPAEIAEKLAALAEDGARRMHQLELPLIEIHRKQGLTVAEVAGIRMTVPIRVA